MLVWTPDPGCLRDYPHVWVTLEPVDGSRLHRLGSSYPSLMLPLRHRQSFCDYVSLGTGSNDGGPSTLRSSPASTVS
jgi:hypothetical protein